MRNSGTEDVRSGRTLTLRGIVATPVVLPLRRPIVARIATIDEWPVILVDLHTDEGVVGRAYLEPYTPRAMKYLVAALHDLGETLKGKAVAPVELYAAARKSLHFVGYSGMSMIAVSGLDMAAWDALASEPRLRSTLYQHDTARAAREAMLHPDDLLSGVREALRQAAAGAPESASSSF